MGGMVKIVNSSALNTVETTLHVITWLVSVMEAVLLDGQGFCVTKVCVFNSFSLIWFDCIYIDKAEIVLVLVHMYI